MAVMLPSLLKARQRTYVFASLGMFRKVTATDSQLCQLSQKGCARLERGRSIFAAIGADMIAGFGDVGREGELEDGEEGASFILA